MIRRSTFVGLMLILAVHPCRAGDEPTPAQLEDAIFQGVSLLSRAATNYPTHRTCFSCHHQTLPMLALYEARGALRVASRYEGDRLSRKADAIDDVMDEQAAFIRDSFKDKLASMREGKGVGGGAMTVGYALWAFDLARCRLGCVVQADETIQAMLEFLKKTQQPDGNWSTGNRPPLEQSTVTCTLLAARGLDFWAKEEAHVKRAKTWLANPRFRVQEDRAFRLYAASTLLADEDGEAPASSIAIVTATQHADGGWSSRDDMPSDAYATGQSLYALNYAGMKTNDPVFRRGIAYLMETRQPDGSWKMETRSKPIQVYFDNGDPHGKHQFISTPATCWAITALAVALSERIEEPYDLVIENGRIVDGTGNPWFKGDVAIRGDRIVAVGKLPGGVEAKSRLDARGLIVVPGFIDMHSHSDMPLLTDGAGLSKITQGVTTEILGEDTSGGPSKGKRSEKTHHKGEKTFRWSTLGGYLDTVEQSGTSVNVASYVGLGSLLDCVLGDSLARPTAEELDEVKTLLDEALREGAFGLSTMLAGPRELNVTTEDLVELCKVVKEHNGIFSSHIRNEGTDVLAAIDEAIAIGERSGVPVDVIHLKIAEQSLWGRMSDVLARFESARARGVNVQANVYPYTRGNNDLVTILPPWAHEGGKKALLSRLRDPEQRARIKHDVREGLPGWYNHYTAVGGDWSKMLIAARLSEKNAHFQGKTMEVVLAERSKAGADPLDVFLDFLAEESGAVSTIYAHHTEADMNLALTRPWCSIGSDGSALAIVGPLRSGNPHPRSFGTFPRILGVYVRERHLLTLEDAVRKMTSLNAAKLGLRDRGLLRPRLCADVTVFDPDKVIDRATYLEPFQYSEGIVHVVVNGALVLKDGKPTTARPGRALRKERE
jgi:N-acyl-D-amino-acid deacylase